MIFVKHDNKLRFPTIEVPMYSEDERDGGNTIKQTNIEGVLVPLIRYNNYTITFEMIKYMKLTCDVVPAITVEFEDYTGMIKSMDPPGLDNILYLQILPPFDNAYKKIQLSFYVTNISMDNHRVTLSGAYYIPDFFNNVMKAYGMISSYELFEQISNDYGLGFCSNMDNTNDKRWIYNPNLSPTNFLNKEILYSGDKEHVYTWWIDFWNNLNFIDLFNEYSEIVPDDELQIWLPDNFKDNATSDANVTPRKRIAAFTNNPTLVTDPMYIFDYTPVVNSYGATDRNFEIFRIDEQDRISTLIQDGDIRNDVFRSYEYGGELFGKYDYLTQCATRNMFLGKIYGQTIEVSSSLPILGLMKGGHVNLWWYDVNNYMTSDADNNDINSNIPLPGDMKDEDNTFIINKTISGQYYILGIELEYSGIEWDCRFKLSRSADSIQRINPPSNDAFMGSTEAMPEDSGNINSVGDLNNAIRTMFGANDGEERSINEAFNQ